ncbi:MAG: hypothetical protein IT307_11400 [Chloroflexi bacterium]|nr:hypothetical protein [Chloroflexota bacterium]
MFNRIRWRLVAWSMAVLVLILLVLGTAVYVALSKTLVDQVDRDLASRSEQANSVFEAMARDAPARQGDRDRDDRSGYRGGVFYLLVGPDGRLIANPQQARVSGASLPVPSDRGGAYATLALDGEPTRVFTRFVSPRAPAGTMVVVGQSLAPEQSALRSLLAVLIGGGVIGLLLSLAGAWFLAGRSLVPIERAFRRQQEFVADASHELRTPLTVLRSATDLLNQHRDEPLASNGELFDDIRSEIVRLQRLASDLLTLARSDRGELELAVAEIDVGALAAEMTRRTEPLARERGVNLAFRQDGPSPIVEADPDRLQQVLLVLLDNAIKHTPADGRVELTVRGHGGDAIVELADTGPGIAPEHLPRIFDRFYRADLARTRSDGGTGLGLAIAKTLVEAHGGDLTVHSVPGAGTRAILRLRHATPSRHTTSLGSLAARLNPSPRRTRSHRH